MRTVQWHCPECDEFFGDQTRVYCPKGHGFPLTVCEEISAKIFPKPDQYEDDLRRQLVAAETRETDLALQLARYKNHVQELNWEKRALRRQLGNTKGALTRAKKKLSAVTDQVATKHLETVLVH